MTSYSTPENFSKQNEISIWENYLYFVFTAAQFTADNKQVESTQLSIYGWLHKKLSHIYTLEYYLAIRKNEILFFAKTRV